MCFAVHALSHRWSMSGTVGRVLFDNEAGNRQDVAHVQCPSPNFKRNQGIVFLEEVSQSSKNSVLSMLVINSFDFSLNGLKSSVLFKSCINEPRFG